MGRKGKIKGRMGRRCERCGHRAPVYWKEQKKIVCSTCRDEIVYGWSSTKK